MIAIVVWTAALALMATAVLISPMLLLLVDTESANFGRLSDIGQAYGPVSTLLSAIAVCVAVLVQRRQLRQERMVMARELHAGILKTAMEEPSYTQCWGPRVAPTDVDERLFYYTSSIISTWYYGWDCGELSDDTVRAYVRAMADSEIPRMYWASYGAWRLSAARGRQRRFMGMVDTEFRAVMAAGPPLRRAEPAVARQQATEPTRPVTCCRPARSYSGRSADRTFARKWRH
ncbi:DUF6082 family protein [Catenuloplanes atrovinosus]|uniref:DUF6082 family protein n=1 Tax=Catenuloplanes atrovinosus TaxID=137266 RepID=UPI00286C16FE|nr:DUF6082 family protein [Catenuloplanes atrovinosus]